MDIYPIRKFYGLTYHNESKMYFYQIRLHLFISIEQRILLLFVILHHREKKAVVCLCNIEDTLWKGGVRMPYD